MAIEDKIRVSSQDVVAIGDGVSKGLRLHDIDAVAIGDGVSTGLRLHHIDAIAVGGLLAPYLLVNESNAIFVGTDEGKATMLIVHDQNVVVVGAADVLPESPLAVDVFPYDIDGHVFYGLHIRGRGTFVYDLMTQQWTEWRTADFPFWNAQFHVRWRENYYASSKFENQINRINPNSILDDSFRNNSFIATGRLESQSREYVSNPEAQVFGSVGLRGGNVSLRYSDDEGKTWSSYETVTTTAGVRNANVMFYDLGSVTAPGRIFQLEDFGTLRRIQSLKVKLGDD